MTPERTAVSIVLLGQFKPTEFVPENTGSVLALEHPCSDNPAHGRKMQLEVFGDLAVAVRVGAIGGIDRIVAIAVFARKECSVRRPAKQAYACRTVPMQNGARALLICL